MSLSLEQKMRPSLGWRVCVAGLLAATFLAVDRVAKVAVLAALRGGVWRTAMLPGILRFEFVANTGAAFSLGEGHGLAFVVLAAVVCVACAVYLFRAPAVSRLEVVGMGMVVGGAVGNAIDRVLYGFVVDFIATEFIGFPVFNIADIGITCGVVIAFVGYLFFSPAAREVDATAELNARDSASVKRRSERIKRRVEKSKRAQ